MYIICHLRQLTEDDSKAGDFLFVPSFNYLQSTDWAFFVFKLQSLNGILNIGSSKTYLCWSIAKNVYLRAVLTNRKWFTKVKAVANLANVIYCGKECHFYFPCQHRDLQFRLIDWAQSHGSEVHAGKEQDKRDCLHFRPNPILTSKTGISEAFWKPSAAPAGNLNLFKTDRGKRKT
jgi:hypothetical protein